MSEKTTTAPMTAGDLREIARYLDRVCRAVGEFGEYTKLGEPIVNLDAEIRIPDDDGDPVGRIVFYDDWIGFAPYRCEADR